MSRTKQYFFNLSAENSIGKSKDSVEVLSFRAGERPSPPTITAVEKSDKTPNMVLIHYTPPADNGGAKIQQYAVRAEGKILHTTQATDGKEPISVEGLATGQM
jgi:hypothetical protein